MSTDRRPLSCLSCEHHRPTGCALRRSGWPTYWLASCSDGCYAPGSDEREDRDLAALEKLKTAQNAL